MDPIPGWKTGITVLVDIALNVLIARGAIDLSVEQVVALNGALVSLIAYFLGKRMNRHAGDG